ncbi:MAG: hypothetical protein H7833_17865 [Magnetococcus sp. DMHC-1]
MDPAGQLVEDLPGNRPGRGVYIQPTRQHVIKLVRRQGQLQRLSRHPLILPDPEVLQERISQALTRRLIDGIGLARRGKMLSIDKPLELPSQEQMGAACGQITAPLLALPEGKMARRVRADVLRWQTFFSS